MSDFLLGKKEPRSDSEYKLAIDHMLVEIDRIDEKIEKDQVDINRLRVETRITLDQLKKTLAC